jgi:hypothetical protein
VQQILNNHWWPAILSCQIEGPRFSALMHWCIGQGVNHSSTKIAVLGERTEVEWGCLMQLVMQFQCSCILRFHGHLNLHLQQLHLHLGWLKRQFASKNWRRWKKTPQLQQLQCLLWLLRIPQSPRLCWCCQHAAHAMVALRFLPSLRAGIAVVLAGKNMLLSSGCIWVLHCELLVQVSRILLSQRFEFYFGDGIWRVS